MNTPELQEIVKTFEGPSPHGCSCKFIKVNDSIGIKCYTKRHRRDIGFYHQTRMAEYGFAPKTLGVFEIDDTYCYVTEVATPLVEGDEYYDDNYITCCKNVKSTYTDIDKRISKLISDMKEVGYSYCDIHYANFGILNDKLVAIDFTV